MRSKSLGWGRRPEPSGYPWSFPCKPSLSHSAGPPSWSRLESSLWSSTCREESTEPRPPGAAEAGSHGSFQGGAHKTTGLPATSSLSEYPSPCVPSESVTLGVSDAVPTASFFLPQSICAAERPPPHQTSEWFAHLLALSLMPILFLCRLHRGDHFCLLNYFSSPLGLTFLFFPSHLARGQHVFGE